MQCNDVVCVCEAMDSKRFSNSLSHAFTHAHTNIHKFQFRFTLENSLKSPFTFYGKQLRIIHIRWLCCGWLSIRTTCCGKDTVSNAFHFIAMLFSLTWSVQRIPKSLITLWTISSQTHYIHSISRYLHSNRSLSLSAFRCLWVSSELSLDRCYPPIALSLLYLCISGIKTMFFIQCGWLHQALGLYLT